MKDEELELQFIRDFAFKNFNNLSAIINEQITDKSLQGYILFSVVVRMFLIAQYSLKDTKTDLSIFKRLLKQQKKDLAASVNQQKKRKKK